MYLDLDSMGHQSQHFPSMLCANLYSTFYDRRKLSIRPQKPKKAVLLHVIKQKVRSGSKIHSDGWTAYDGLVDVGYRKHYRVHHGQDEFARGHLHINGIENFWGLAKVRLMKYRGIHPKMFLLHLKECEFRFNYRNEDLYAILLSLFKEKSPTK